MSFRAFLMAAMACTVIIPAAEASDLRVTPVLIEPLPGARTSSLTLVNEEQRPVQVQVRVMRWRQADGEDRLEETRDVVVSPPFASVAPGEHYMIRIVRTAQTSPKGEESYRVFVDEVPQPGQAQPGTVDLILRQSIPAFFSDIPQRVSIVDWSVEAGDEGLWLTASNRGDRRLRLSDIVIENHDGVVYEQSGLVGYILPGASMRWPVAADPSLAQDRTLHLRGVSDTGMLEVSLVDIATR